MNVKRAPAAAPLDRESLTQAEAFLGAADRTLAALIAEHGPCRLHLRAAEPFETLIASIVGQQLSSRAAAAIHGRLLALAGAPPLTAEALLRLDAERLRGAGLSRAKVRYLRAAAEAQRDRRLDWARIAALDDEAAIRELVQLPGVGRWTAEMLLIFAFGRLDVYAFGDLGLRRTVERLYRGGRPLTDLGLRRITNRWRPYRSVASWYLWRYLDGETTLW